MFEKVNVPILGVVENMSYIENPDDGGKIFLFGNGGGKQTAEDLETQLLGMALNQEVREGGDHGIPVIISNPNAIQVWL